MRKTKQRETERECVRVSELKGQERVGGKERETKTKQAGGKNSASEKKRGRRTEKESTLGMKG